MIEYGLLGGTLGHSWSKPIHAMLAPYRYELYPVSPEEMRSILRERAFKGLNVTIPYKRDVMPFCDEISPQAQAIGSVNTLVMGSDGRLRGDNTDLYGFLSMARRAGIALRGKKVVILGTGGTSLTAQAACREEGARQTVVVSRSGPVDYDALRRDHVDLQVLINTTPVGMYPNTGVAAVDLGGFPACEGVIDVIYNPLRTRLLQDARERGIRYTDGLWMLVAQAKRAAELFTGRAIDDGEIGRVHAALRADMANVVLIGMPGCGKSSVGAALSALMDRPLVDLDAEIAREAGVSVPDIIAREGVDAFRDRERAAAERVGREKSRIIAAGGGAVTREDTMRALSQNAVVIFIERPLSALPTEGRPLSAGPGALERLWAAREPLYRRWADMTVENLTSIDGAVKAVREAFYEAAGH